MKRIRPKRAPLRPDGLPMTEEDLRQLHDQLAEFGDVEWIDAGAREAVERFMPDLVDRLPDRTTETLEQAAGKVRAAAARKATKRRKSRTETQRS